MTDDIFRLKEVLSVGGLNLSDEFFKEYQPEYDFQIMLKNGKITYSSKRAYDYQQIQIANEASRKGFSKVYKRNFFVNILLLIKQIELLLTKTKVDLHKISTHQISLSNKIMIEMTFKCAFPIFKSDGSLYGCVVLFYAKKLPDEFLLKH